MGGLRGSQGEAAWHEANAQIDREHDRTSSGTTHKTNNIANSRSSNNSSKGAYVAAATAASVTAASVIGDSSGPRPGYSTGYEVGFGPVDKSLGAGTGPESGGTRTKNFTNKLAGKSDTADFAPPRLGSELTRESVSNARGGFAEAPKANEVSGHHHHSRSRSSSVGASSRNRSSKPGGYHQKSTSGATTGAGAGAAAMDVQLGAEAAEWRAVVAELQGELEGVRHRRAVDARQHASELRHMAASLEDAEGRATLGHDTAMALDQEMKRLVSANIRSRAHVITTTCRIE